MGIYFFFFNIVVEGREGENLRFYSEVVIFFFIGMNGVEGGFVGG